jgi:hypothetical protein
MEKSTPQLTCCVLAEEDAYQAIGMPSMKTQRSSFFFLSLYHRLAVAKKCQLTKKSKNKKNID